MKNICIVAVKEFYRNVIKYDIKRLTDYGWNVYILTDDVEFFKDIENVICEYYPYFIFSYIDKILFPIRTSIKIQQPTIGVDAKWVSAISDEFLMSEHESESFQYYNKWHTSEYMSFIHDDYFNVLLEYLEYINFDYHKVPTILEHIFYVPYVYNLSSVQKEIEMIKPIMEYQSILGGYPYPGVGNAEGFALSYAIVKTNNTLENFKIYPFFQHKPNRFVLKEKRDKIQTNYKELKRLI